jgi:hypothetical protein
MKSTARFMQLPDEDRQTDCNHPFDISQEVGGNQWDESNRRSAIGLDSFDIET